MWGLIALSLFMAVPLMLIGEFAVDRAGYRAAVETEISATWGGAQTLTGPFVVIPVEATRKGQKQLTNGAFEAQEEKVRVAPLVLLPEVLAIASDLSTELRRRGIFEVPVYRGRHEISLEIDPARAAGLLDEGETVLWDQAVLALGIADPRALRGTLILEGNAEPAEFEPGSGIDKLAGVHARIGDPRGHEGGWRFTLDLNGSQRFRLTPAGRTTRGRVQSDWPHPSFAGAFLPDSRAVDDDGFEAEWLIPHLARSLPQAFRGTGRLGELGRAGFGVDLFQPVDLYHKAQRAAKYGILFIAMTFGAIFLMESAAARPTHLAQYALIGAAQCVFFLLLLSLAEQIGFGLAYVLATLATIGLLTAYAWSALGLGRRSWRLPGAFSGALGLLYGVMYLILSAEEQALLMGAMLAFLTVAATMWGTRKEDWGATFGGLRLRRPAQGRERQPQAG
jgi:inner membrane protein